MQHFRPVRGIGLAASVLIGLVALGSIADAASSWYSYAVVDDYVNGSASQADLDGADAITMAIGGPLMLVQLAAMVLFVMWMFRARSNAERLTYDYEHRRKRPWIFWGWIVPIVNLFYPKQIIDDIWRASDPAQQTVALQQRQRAGLVTAWWAGYLLMTFLDRILLKTSLRPDVTPATMHQVASVSTAAALATLVTAALAALVVARISDFQSVPVTPASEAPAPAA